jgi:glucosamine--fructose-6-phosphate aminotransferase (isomerizing)
MSLKTEILSQPKILDRLLGNQIDNVRSVARVIRERRIETIFLAARGSSDHAGLYAKYLLGSFNRLPIALAAPSLFSIYGSPPALRNTLVLGISQSGQSPDIVAVLEEGRRQGALTLAITNDPRSPLAGAADHIIDLAVGPEKAVAATKTYTAQLMAVAMLSVALGDDHGRGDQGRLAELARVPSLIEGTLALDSEIEQVVERYRYMQQCVVLGRGYNYATAYEWALKLKELTYIIAEPYSSADFQHGPVAVVSSGFPVLSVVPQGAIFDDMMTLLSMLVKERGVELVALSNEERALTLAHTPLPLPSDLPEWLSPLVGIVPAQLFSYHLARTKGHDVEAPRGLSKVTLTH